MKTNQIVLPRSPIVCLPNLPELRLLLDQRTHCNKNYLKLFISFVKKTTTKTTKTAILDKNDLETCAFSG